MISLVREQIFENFKVMDCPCLLDDKSCGHIKANEVFRDRQIHLQNRWQQWMLNRLQKIAPYTILETVKPALRSSINFIIEAAARATCTAICSRVGNEYWWEQVLEQERRVQASGTETGPIFYSYQMCRFERMWIAEMDEVFFRQTNESIESTIVPQFEEIEENAETSVGPLQVGETELVAALIGGLLVARFIPGIGQILLAGEGAALVFTGGTMTALIVGGVQDALAQGVTPEQLLTDEQIAINLFVKSVIEPQCLEKTSQARMALQSGLAGGANCSELKSLLLELNEIELVSEWFGIPCTGVLDNKSALQQEIERICSVVPT